MFLSQKVFGTRHNKRSKFDCDVLVDERRNPFHPKIVVYIPNNLALNGQKPQRRWRKRKKAQYDQRNYLSLSVLMQDSQEQLFERLKRRLVPIVVPCWLFQELVVGPT